MFETLDVMISLGVIFLILSMVLKHIMSIIKRGLNIKAKVVAEEMKTFVGENTSEYLIPYLEKKSKHLNFIDDIKGKKGLRQLDKDQLKEIATGLKGFLESKSVEKIKEELDLKINEDTINEKIDEIKNHLDTLKDRVEHMYENTITKIGEVYVNRLRILTLICGLVLAVLVNADFFDIYNSLSKNSIVRDKLVAQAEAVKQQMDFISKQIELKQGEEIKALKPFGEEARKDITNLTGELNKTGLSLGWTKEKLGGSFRGIGSFVYKLFGLIISGLLISFGAPFWHEFLSSIVGIKKKIRRVQEKGRSNG